MLERPFPLMPSHIRVSRGAPNSSHWRLRIPLPCVHVQHHVERCGFLKLHRLFFDLLLRADLDAQAVPFRRGAEHAPPSLVR